MVPIWNRDYFDTLNKGHGALDAKTRYDLTHASKPQH